MISCYSLQIKDPFVHSYTYLRNKACPTPPWRQSKMLLLLLSLHALVAAALAQADCSVFQEGACPLEESNILGTSGAAANPAECQSMCKFEPTGACNFFTFLGTECYLLAR